MHRQLQSLCHYMVKYSNQFFARASGESANNTHQLSWGHKRIKVAILLLWKEFFSSLAEKGFLPGKFSLKSVPVNSAHATIVNVLSCADGFNQAALIHKFYIAFKIMPHSPPGFRRSV